MNPVWVIQKKRDGGKLAEAEIRSFIEGVADGSIPDYQATAWLMAVYFRGMSMDETVALTRAMLESGVRYDLTALKTPMVDKHSTGGVGDKVSLILAPLAAACGAAVPMMSGRGLGHSGGTLDKLESIPGFNVKLDEAEFKRVLREVGCAMIGQSERIAPADKKLYSLRDVTGTVECIPLITASILSKKLAEGTQSLVLDVKVGSGAFMKSKDQARKLARTLVAVATKMGLPTRAILTDMSQPLGNAVGNSLEVLECVNVLRNRKDPEGGSTDLRELTLDLCAQMLELSRVVKNVKQGRQIALKKLADGSAWRVFEKLVAEQGGDLARVRDPETLPLAKRQVTWKAKRKGFVTRIQTEEIGKLLVALGGGRTKAADAVDPSVGFVFHRKLGAKVAVGDPLVTVYAPDTLDLAPLEARFQAAVEIGGVRKAVPKLILERI